MPNDQSPQSAAHGHGARQILRSHIPLYLATVSLITFLLFTGSTGHLARADEVFGSLHDARMYLRVTEFLAGDIEHIDEYRILGKPVVYPAFLLLHRLIGIRAFVLLQHLLVAATVFMVWSSVARLTRSRAAATSATLPILTSVTVIYFPLFAMTEILALALCSAVALLVSRHARLGTIDSSLHVLAVMTLALCVRPAFLPLVVFWAIYLGTTVGQRLHRLVTARPRNGILNATARRIPLLLLCASPIIVQVGFSYSTVGSIGGWGVGSKNLSIYFFPIVYGDVEARLSGDEFVDKNHPLASEAGRAYPETADKLSYLVAHPFATAKACLFNLFRLNIAQPSRALWETRDLVSYDALARRTTRFSGWINTGIAVLHIAFLLLVPLAVIVSNDSATRRFLVLGFSLAWLLLGTAASAYWAGDRLVTPALPLWASVYTVAGWAIVRRIRAGRFQNG